MTQIERYEVAKCAAVENRGKWYVRAVDVGGLTQDESAVGFLNRYRTRKEAEENAALENQRIANAREFAAW